MNATIQVRLINSATGEVIEANGQKIEETYAMDKVGWVDNKSYDFTLPEGIECVKIQILSKQDNYDGDNLGDIALDDIIFRVCTPPDVAVDAKLSPNSHAKDLLDLCVDDELILEALLSDEAKGYYEKPEVGYLFQYAEKDPTDPTFNPKTDWKDLKEGDPVQKEETFTIKDPANHKAFKNVQKDSKIYFRVVIGEYNYLKDQRSMWEDMDALSPCRHVSFSTIPIIAGLNCAACEKPVDPDIKGATTDTKVVKNASGLKEVNLCLGEIAHLTVENIEAIDQTVMGVKDPNSPHKYIATWHKGSKTAAGVPGIGYTDGDPTSSLDVTYEDADLYYIKLVDLDFPSSDGSSCHKWDSVKVIANPKPDATLTGPSAFCEGKLTSEPTKTITGYDIHWYTAADTLTSATEPTVANVLATESPKTLYYVLQDSKTGCRGEAAPYEITVNPIPSETLAAIAAFCEGSTTASLPTSQNGYTVTWYESDKTTLAESDLRS